MHQSNIILVCLHCVITCTMYSQTSVQQLPLGNGKVTVIIQGDNLYMSGQLCRKFKATENFGKLSGDCNIQGDLYIQGCYIQHYLEFVIHGGRGSSACGSLINKTTELKVKL